MSGITEPGGVTTECTQLPYCSFRRLALAPVHEKCILEYLVRDRSLVLQTQCLKLCSSTKTLNILDGLVILQIFFSK
jgi:hypothetical protein